ncbi:transposase [Hymenobacter gelipurpurascens]|uniref:transposase n=1 Tax=Hymenobacter gelipurpurascens TaxID=89968 RepID=UPI000B5927BC
MRWSRQDGQKKDVYFLCNDSKNERSVAQRRKYDEAFKAEALRLASESRSTQAAARQLGISPKLLYRWQQA